MLAQHILNMSLEHLLGQRLQRAGMGPGNLQKAVQPEVLVLLQMGSSLPQYPTDTVKEPQAVRSSNFPLDSIFQLKSSKHLETVGSVVAMQGTHL